MRVLSIGDFKTYGESCTCRLRNMALKSIFNNNVDTVNSYFNYSFLNKVINYLFQKGISVSFFGVDAINYNIINLVRKNRYDIVWVDKGISIKKETLLEIKKISPSTLIVGYSPDEMSRRHNQSNDFLKSLHYYDAYITTKSYSIDELLKLGAKKVYFVNKSYQDDFHYPREINNVDIERLGGDIGFIGAWEDARASSILFLAKKGLNIRVWGGGEWLSYKGLYPNLIIEDSGLYSEDYPKALRCFKINLCFLRKKNSDLQTARTMEIPASGGFMLAERTEEHSKLFLESVEADFFSNDEELYEKVVFYLQNDALRKKMIDAASLRCISSGYSNKKTLENVINKILKDFKNV